MASAPGFIASLPIGPFSSRPRLTGAIVVGVAAGLLLALVPNALKPSTRGILAWDVGCIWFVVASLIGMSGKEGRDIQELAALQDDGRGMILGLVLLSSAASLATVGVELSLAKTDHGLFKIARVAFALTTVVASWFVAQLIFAIHYAHEYYSLDAGSPPTLRRGLKFPEGGDPDYWDFLHFSVIIGVAAQTADISYVCRGLRRIGTVHSLLAFTFNTVVVALTINLWAGVF